MKTLLVATFLCMTSALMAQTSIIGIKSHHGNIAELPQSIDKFGEMEPMPVVDTLVKINNECVIQIGEDNGWGMAFRDTVCDHWYYKNVEFDADKIQEYHGGNVTLVGFNDDQGSIQKEKSKFFKKRSKKQSTKWFLIASLLMIVPFLFVMQPKLAPIRIRKNTKLLLVLVCLSGSSLFAQTTVIAVKSQHGNMAEIQKAEDHFGVIAPRPFYDTLIRLSGDCVVQIGRSRYSYGGADMPFRDTVCEHWYYQKVEFDEKLIREYHGENIVLIGFEETDNYREENSPYFRKRTVKQSSKWIVILLILVGIGTYIAHPNLFSRSKS